MEIPKNIILFWHDKIAMPADFNKCITMTMKSHSGFELIFSDDDDVKKIIRNEFSQFIDLYERNRIPASRSDIARLILLYKFGGIYFDMSMEFYKPLSDIISMKENLVLVRRDDLPQFKNNPENAHFINGIIASPPRSNFILHCLKKIYFNLSSGIHNYYVTIATGPIVITEAITEKRNAINFTPLSFSVLKENYFKSRKIAGISNRWVKMQGDGIIDSAHYDQKGLLDEVWQKFQFPPG